MQIRARGNPSICGDNLETMAISFKAGFEDFFGCISEVAELTKQHDGAGCSDS